jgi:hypothetical protein
MPEFEIPEQPAISIAFFAQAPYYPTSAEPSKFRGKSPLKRFSAPEFSPNLAQLAVIMNRPGFEGGCWVYVQAASATSSLASSRQ